MPGNSLENNLSDDEKRSRDKGAHGEDEDTFPKEESLNLVYEYFNREIGEKLKTLETKSNELDTKYKQIEEKLEKNQTQYITILGIFASIVLAFVGAFTFSTSVLAHMHEVSFYRLSFVILCIAFLVVNILQGLFDFLRNIHDNKYEKKYKLFTWFNMLIFFAMLCIFIHYSIRESFVFNQIESRIPWLIWLFA